MDPALTQAYAFPHLTHLLAAFRALPRLQSAESALYLDSADRFLLILPQADPLPALCEFAVPADPSDARTLLCRRDTAAILARLQP